jgi:hypothetical protein
MTPRRTALALFSLGAILAMLACSLPAPSPAPQVDPTAVGTESPVTDAPETALPAAESFIVAHLEPEFRIYALDGTLVETRPAPGLSYARPNTAQVVGEAIYYVAASAAQPGEVVRRVTATENVELDFTRSSDPTGLAFSVSQDGSRIAWSQTSWAGGPPFSQLWAAGIDGAAPTLVAQTDDTDDIAEFFVLEPVLWLDDGDLVYAWQVSGIGGYILFFGWSSLYRYDAAAGTTPLAGLAPDVTAPCWTDVTPDGGFTLGACGDAHAIVERDIAGGGVTTFPPLPEQGQAGAATYSPEPGRLAYGIARGDPEDEFGQLILVAGSGIAPTALASQPSGAFERIDWIDGEQLAVSYWQGSGLAASFVDLIGIDGNRNPVGEGRLIGLMRR